MKPSALITGLDAATVLPSRPLHLAIGMFDGMHLGHRAVVESALRSARRAKGIAAALTFDPHPSRVLRPDKAVAMIQPVEARVDALTQEGLDAVIVHRFSREYASVEAADFLPHLRQRLPYLAGIYVGENWRYGRGRAGDISSLIEAGKAAGVTVVSAPRINHNGRPISSTRVRECLGAGQLEEANELLGYSYGGEGTTVAGKQLGRTIGFPTLNIEWMVECRPRLGVYAVRVRDESDQGSEWQNAVANFGLRPTVENSTVPRLEVHVLDGTQLTTGARVRVEWLRFIRDERRFDSLEQLREQIAADTAVARAYFLAADGAGDFRR